MPRKALRYSVCFLLLAASLASVAFAFAQTAAGADLTALGRDDLLALYEGVAGRLRATGHYPFVHIAKNQTGAEVEALQARLTELGYLLVEGTGKHDNASVAAMKKFEKAQGLKDDGVATVKEQALLFSDENAPAPTVAGIDLAALTPDETLSLLERVAERLNETGYYPYRELSKNQAGVDVRRAQERLIALGYLTKEATGVYDNATIAAMKDFERAHDLSVNGLATPEDLGMLFSKGAVAKPVPTPNLSKDYARMDYAKVMRTPNKYDGKRLSITGEVVQSLDDKTTRAVRMRVATMGRENVVYVTYTLKEGEAKPETGAKVAVYGVCKGLFTYTSVKGKEVSVPHLEMEVLR